jgi:hypothetical protein
MAAAFPPRACYRDRELAIGSIVDTRADAAEDLSECLGVFLAYYLVHCQPGKHASLADLTQRIAGDTGRIKAERRYFDALVNLKLAGTLWPWLSERIRANFMRQVLPMTAGVSNVRVRDTWIDRYGADRILDYARGSPTGPLLPLVLTPTTVGDHMNVGVTYRAIGFCRAKIAGVMARFLEQIECPHGTGRRGTR